MITKQYKKVFEDEVSAFLPSSLVYVPEPKDERIIGLLLTEGFTISLSLKGGTVPFLNQETPSNSTSIAPDKRIIPLDIPLNEEAVNVVIRYSREFPPDNEICSAYFIIQQQND